MYDLLGILVIVIWSTSPALIKQMVLSSNENYLMVVVAYNLIASAITLSIAVFTREHKNLVKISGKAKLVGLMHLNGFYDVAGVLAVTFSAAVQYAIIANYMWPTLLVVFLALARAERISRQALAGCVLGFLAIAVILAPSQGVDFISNLAGVGFGVVAALLWSSYSALLDDEHDSVCFFLQGAAQGISGICALIFAILVGKFSFSDIGSVGSLSLIVLYAVLNMSLAYTLWILVVVRHANMQRFSSMVYVLPILSIVVTTLWFGQALNPRIWVATPLVLGGIAISRVNARRIIKSSDS